MGIFAPWHASGGSTPVEIFAYEGEETRKGACIRLSHATLSVPNLSLRGGYTDLDPVLAVRQLQQLCQRLIVVPGADELSREAQKNATFMFLSLLRSQLASKRLLRVSD